LFAPKSTRRGGDFQNRSGGFDSHSALTLISNLDAIKKFEIEAATREEVIHRIEEGEVDWDAGVQIISIVLIKK